MLRSTSLSPARPALPLLLAFGLLAACDPGPGGTASISGQVVLREYDVFGNLFREYPAADERVYLVFGDQTVIGEETRTHFSGRYTFPFLRKGRYTVYGYQDCGACPGGEEAVILELEIARSGEALEAPVLYLNAE